MRSWMNYRIKHFIINIKKRMQVTTWSFEEADLSIIEYNKIKAFIESLCQGA